MKAKRKSPLNLTITLSFTVFFVLILTMIVASAIVMIMFYTGLLSDFSEIGLIKGVALLAVISVIVGTTLATVFGSTLLSPFRILNRAMKRLAGGDFATRIDLSSRFAAYEFNELTSSFNRMAEQLGSVEMLSSDFINNVSHEFKTPIVSLKGFARLLKNKNLTDRQRDEYIDIIISETDRLSTLAGSILMLSKIEHQSIILSSRPYDLTEQIRCAILLLENKWTQKNLNLAIDLQEVTYNGNEELLNLVWINLIDNAIKFCEPNGSIAVRLSHTNGDVTFEIKDNGCGMDAETKLKSFDKFYQGDRSHSVEGNGIGLTIVQKVVELYDGEIFIDSALNQGTLVVIELPHRRDLQTV